MQNRNISKGILFALGASIISGVAIFYAKLSVAKVNPLLLTTLRNSTAGLLFFTVLASSGLLTRIKSLKPKQLATLFVIGIFGGALPFYLFFTGLQFTSALLGNLIQKSLFIWVGILSVLFLKEKLNRRYIISFILLLIANFYFVRISFSFGKGELMILAAALLWSVETILAKKLLQKIPPEIIGFFRMGLGSLTLCMVSLFNHQLPIVLTYDFPTLLTILTGGVILFTYVFVWLKALQYAPASLVTVILTFATVVGAVLNGSFGLVKIPMNDIYPLILISIALFLTFFNKSRFWPSHG